MKAKPRMLAPSECNTEAKVCKLSGDNISTARAWILAGDRVVTICEEQPGKDPVAFVEITVADMRKFARWFLRKQRRK